LYALCIKFTGSLNNREGGESVVNQSLKIELLSEIFSPYKIYPLLRYTEGSPVRNFQKLYPENYYSKAIEIFLSKHDYEPIRRGADLPWWGKKFFSKKEGYKVMIISQDSLSRDAGSIVLFAHLFNEINSQGEYDYYISGLNENQNFGYKNWRMVRDQFIRWNIDLDFCYITDAAKVYKEGSWKDGDFDRVRSKILLEREIDICEPDLIIMLGAKPLNLLKKRLKYSSIVEKGETISVKGIECVVSPFITGQGPTQRNYKKRLDIASEIIRSRVG